MPPKLGAQAQVDILTVSEEIFVKLTHVVEKASSEKSRGPTGAEHGFGFIVPASIQITASHTVSAPTQQYLIPCSIQPGRVRPLEKLGHSNGIAGVFLQCLNQA